MEITSIKTTIFSPGDSLISFIKKHVPVVTDTDILVITSKLVALSEQRIVPLSKKDKIIIVESKRVIKTPWAYLTETGDGWSINAGADESNAQGKLILLPAEPFASAKRIHKELKKYYGLKKLGVLITDTKSVPLRVGTIGRALAFAGFLPYKNYIGKSDLFGRKNQVTQSNLADALAAAAVLTMGEGKEQTPLALIKQAPIVFCNKNLKKSQQKLSISPQNDIFSFLYRGRDSRER